MSKLCRNGDDFPDAASKHVADARQLFENGRYDNAGYLAGYVVECVLKAIILAEGGRPKFTHDVGNLSQDVLSLIGGLAASKTAKYISSPQITSLQHGLNNGGWEEVLRYRSPYLTQATAQIWVVEAERLYREVINEMLKDSVA